jgi:acyl dehydratase
MAELYLEDFAVGQRFISADHTLDADQIKDFASRFDPQPFHLDEAAAQASFRSPGRARCARATPCMWKAKCWR